MSIKTRPSLLEEVYRKAQKDYRRLYRHVFEQHHNDDQAIKDLVDAADHYYDLKSDRMTLRRMRRSGLNERFSEYLDNFLSSTSRSQFDEWLDDRYEDDVIGEAKTYMCPVQHFLCDFWLLPSWAVRVGTNSIRLDDGETAYEAEPLPGWALRVMTEFDDLFAEEEKITKAEFLRRKAAKG